VVGERISNLRRDWKDSPKVIEHLDRLGQEIIQSADRFSANQEETQEVSLLPIDQDVFSNFRVNVIVARDPAGGAPVVEEANPTHHNLLGRIEHRVLFGMMVADFREIWGGALHEGNGGYLILETSDLLRQPFAWIGLKKALQTHSVRPEEFGEYTGAATTSTLRPEPIPLQCKVILIGDPYIYLLLRAYDEDFQSLFKVKADFRSYMERGRDEERAYASFVAQRCSEESLPPFDASAIARIVEHGSRVAGHQSRLTTRFELIADLIREAVYYAAKDSSDTVGVGHVGNAIAARERRVGRPERELLQLIEEDVLAVEPSGEEVGQLYGLAVLSSGDHTFARPIKLEASAFMGTSGVVDIEREVRLGGPLHNKGVLVLSGYLGDLFAQDHPLILSATVSFDQLYDEVEGDSASAAELFALVSAIAGVPIKQGIAITGALNQKGEIQPIGGVTTKIEGFFRACQRRGLTGEQGVIIPARNLSNLVLNDEVIAAVQEGAFRIWPIRHVEEGWRILTDMAVGQKDAHGAFPADTVYGQAAAQLRGWATGWREFGSPVREGRPRATPAGADAEPE
jgi:lon-related putative ATP-dependent protease